METTKITRELEFKLNDHEFTEKAHALADLHGKITSLDEELKGHKKRLGDQIKAHETEIEKICRTIEAGVEIRSVECDFKKNFETNTVEYYFEGKLVDERAMEAHERQQEMFNGETPKDVAEAVFADSLI